MRKTNQTAATPAKKKSVVGPVLKTMFLLGILIDLAFILGKFLVSTLGVLLQYAPAIILAVVFWMVVSRIIAGEKNSGCGNPAELYPSISVDTWRAEQAKGKALMDARNNARQVSAKEVAMLREQLKADIDVCLSTAHATWCWAAANSASRIYMTYDANPTGIFEGWLTVSNRRVLEIVVPVPDGAEVRYPNEPLLAAQKAEEQAAKEAAEVESKAKADAFSNALTEFFGTRKGGERITITKLNADDGTFLLTGSLGKFSVKKTKAVAEYKGDAIIAVHILMAGGAKRTIRCGKQTVPKSVAKPTTKSDPTPATVKEDRQDTTADKFAPSPAGKDEKVPAAPMAATANVPVPPREKPNHAGEVDIHQPSGLSPESLQQHVRLYADDAGKVINDTAMTAFNAGKTHCRIDWPEGLLTLEEVEAFAKLMVNDYNFSAYEILEADRKIKLQLGQVNTASSNSFEALLDEMVPTLEASASELYFDEGEEWTEIQWPEEVDSVKAATQFADLLVSKSLFDGHVVYPAGKIRLHLPGEDKEEV